MAEQTDRLHQQIARLRARFIADLPQKRIRLMALWQGLERSWASDAAMDLYSLVHGLKGTAGTFGFHTLCDAMTALDDHLVRCRGLNRLPTAAAMTVMINRARAAITHLLSDPTEPTPPVRLKTVLVAGEDADARARAAEMLRSFGFQVTDAATLGDALADSHGMPPDGLVLLRDFSAHKRQEWDGSLSPGRIFVEDEAGIDGVVAQIMGCISPSVPPPWHLFILSDPMDEPSVRLQEAVEAAGGIAHCVPDPAAGAALLDLVEPDLIVAAADRPTAWVQGRPVEPMGIPGPIIALAKAMADRHRLAALEPVTGVLTGAGLQAALRAKGAVSGAEAVVLAVAIVDGVDDRAMPSSARATLMRRVANLLRLRLRPMPMVAALGEGVFYVWQSGQSLDGLGEGLDRAAKGFKPLTQIDGVSYPVDLRVAVAPVDHAVVTAGDWPSLTRQILAHCPDRDGQDASHERT